MADAAQPRLAPKDGSDRRIRLLFTLGGVFTAAILPFLSLLLHSRGLAADRIGFILGAQALASVLAAPVWSHLADLRLGTPRALVLMSCAGAAVALALLPAGGNPWIVGALVVALGVAWAPGPAFADSLALTTLGPERANDYGAVRLYASAGWAVAVLGFGFLYERQGMELVLPCYAVAILAYAAVASRFPAATPTFDDEAEHRSRFGAVGQALKGSPHLFPMLCGLLLVSMASAAAIAFVPLQIGGGGGGPFLVGAAASGAAFVEIPIFAAGGRLSRRFGMRTLCLVGIGVQVAQLAAWSVLRDPGAIAAVRVSGGISFALTYMAVVVLTGLLVPERLRNSGQAAMQLTSWGLGPIVGSALGGVVYARLGPGALFGGAAVLAAAGAVVIGTALHRVDTREPA